MAKKELKYYNGRLVGSYLSEKECDILDKLRHLSNEQGFVRDLKQCIYNLTPADVDYIKSSGTNEGVDMRMGELEDLQTVGVAYMYYAKRLILGDSVGLGKTVEVCGLLNLLATKLRKEGYDFKFLFLTEKNLVSQTRDALIQFTGEYVEAVYGEKKYVTKFLNENTDELKYSVVGSHSLLTNVAFQQYLSSYYTYLGNIPFDILIIDEAGSILKNKTTQTYASAKIVGDMFDRIILLNATAFEKNLSMFYNQLNFVDDTFLPAVTNFNKRYVQYDYTGMYPRPNGKYKNEDEFKRLVGYRYFARTRKSSGAKFVDCSADVIVSDLSDVQKDLLKKTSLPNMVYDCPGYFFKDDPFFTNTENTPKLKDLVGLVSRLLSNNEQVLIYSLYKEAQECIQNTLFSYGIDCSIMNGETSLRNRNKLIDKFKAGDLNVLITNVQKGLNFGKCNYCIFYSYDSSPSKMVQFEGRMTREFDIVGKHVYLLISRGAELKKFKSDVADEARASDMFAGSDFSCVMSLLLDTERLAKLE